MSGSVLWANLHLLFWLSLYPFTTGWLAVSDVAPTPTVVYALNLLLAGFAYSLLETAIGRLPTDGSRYRDAVGLDRKGLLSIGLYAASIVAALFSPWVSVVIFVAVAVLWLVPDRRIERYLEGEHASGPRGGP